MPEPTRPSSQPGRRTGLLTLASAVFVVGVVAMLYPALAAPVNADDRYWYLAVPGRTEGSFIEAAGWTFSTVASDAENGRLTPLAFLARRLLAIAVTSTAVSTATPIVIVQAFVKLILAGAGILACRGFLLALRRRDEDGSLVGLSRRTVMLTTLVTTALLGAGTQAHAQWRNGWTSYALLTYGAVVLTIGSVALVVWLARRTATGSQVWTVVGMLTAFILGLALNITYELYYVAVPLVVAVILQQPMHDIPGHRLARRAKTLIGGTFTVSFFVVFAAIRWWTSRLCADVECYAPSQMELSGRTAGTALRNLLTAIPGGARDELMSDLRRVGIQDQMPALWTPMSVLVAGLVAISMVVIVHLTRSVDDNLGRGDTDCRPGEARLLLLGALVPLAAALGTALIMALSGSSHELVPQVGQPYRNTMVTWSMIALTAAMVAVAGTLALRSRRRPVVWVITALVITLVGGHTLSANYPALRSYRLQPVLQATDAVQWQVVLGDVTEDGDARRCASATELARHFKLENDALIVLRGADEAFRHYHGTPFCSEGLLPGRS